MENKEGLTKSETSLILKIESLQRESSSRRMELSILITILFATLSLKSKFEPISIIEIYFSYISVEYSNLEIYLSILFYLFILIMGFLILDTIRILDNLNKQLYRYMPLNFSFISNLVRVTLGIIVGLSVVLYTFFFNDNYRKKYEDKKDKKIIEKLSKDVFFCNYSDSIVLDEYSRRKDDTIIFIDTKIIQLNNIIYKCIRKKFKNKKREYITYKFENGKYVDLGIKRVLNDSK